MINVRREGVILKPTSNLFESKSVFNPAIWQEGEKVQMIYRAVDNNGISTLGYALLDGPVKVIERLDQPLYTPTKKYEARGLEDPRIVKIDGVFLMTYVAHDGKNAISCYASGRDLKKLKKGGIISPRIAYKDMPNVWQWTKLKDEYLFFQAFYQNFGGRDILIWHKDFVPFPEVINGKYYFLERILPDIQLVEVDDVGQLGDKYFWLHHLMELGDKVLLECKHEFETRNIGSGAPPVKTADGWLVFYHGVTENNQTRTYAAGVALLDLNEPNKVLARLPEPLFSPEVDYELNGQVNNVVFPTGTALFDGRLYIYYGCADNCIAAASVDLQELLNELKKYPANNNIKYYAG